MQVHSDFEKISTRIFAGLGLVMIITGFLYAQVLGFLSGRNPAQLTEPSISLFAILAGSGFLVASLVAWITRK